jgi:hypothetical protein
MSLSYISDVARLKYNLKKEEVIQLGLLSKQDVEYLETVYLHLHYGNRMDELDPALRLFLIQKKLSSKGFLNTNESYVIHRFQSTMSTPQQLTFDLYIRFQYESVSQGSREMTYRIHRGWKFIEEQSMSSQVLVFFFACNFCFVFKKKKHQKWCILVVIDSILFVYVLCFFSLC